MYLIFEYVVNLNGDGSAVVFDAAVITVYGRFMFCRCFDMQNLVSFLVLQSSY